jgi:hypothetical protein
MRRQRPYERQGFFYKQFREIIGDAVDLARVADPVAHRTQLVDKP